MPSKLEQLQLQFRQKLLLEKEERMVKINGDGQLKTPTRIPDNTTSYQQRNCVPTPQPHAPSPKQQVTPTIRVPPSAKKETSGVDRPKTLQPIHKNLKTRSFAVNNTVSPSGAISQVKATAHNGYVSSRPSVSERKPIAKSVLNGKMKLSGETFKVVHSETRQKQVEAEKPKLVRKPTTDRETRTKVAMSPISGHTPENKDTTDGKLHSFTPKTRLRQETKCTTTRKSPPQTKKSANGSFSSMPKSQTDPNLVQCEICGRSFAKDRIEKHSSICKRSVQKPRKIFDASKMRVKGTEAESFLKKTKRQRTEPQPKKSNWRKQHEDFLASIREAKKVQQHLAAGGKISDLPPPPPSDTSHYVQCPYCKRKFNEGAAERHIPKCKNILSNKKTRK